MQTPISLSYPCLGSLGLILGHCSVGGESPSGKARGFGPRIRRFESSLPSSCLPGRTASVLTEMRLPVARFLAESGKANTSPSSASSALEVPAIHSRLLRESCWLNQVKKVDAALQCCRRAGNSGQPKWQALLWT